MEWAPIMGTIPPLSDAELHQVNALYQQTPRYRLVNDGFGLAGFKQFFRLERTHRPRGRLIGAASLIPLTWFWTTERLHRRRTPTLTDIFPLEGM
jgi:heme a synthase